MLGIGREGRNNISGASYLYLASNIEVSWFRTELIIPFLIVIHKK